MLAPSHHLHLFRERILDNEAYMRRRLGEKASSLLVVYTPQYMHYGPVKQIYTYLPTYQPNLTWLAASRSLHTYIC